MIGQPGARWPWIIIGATLLAGAALLAGALILTMH